MEPIAGLVLDTSAFVPFERFPDHAARPNVLAQAGERPVVLPAIVYAELLAGVRVADLPAVTLRR